MYMLVLAAILSAAVPANASTNSDILALERAAPPAAQIAACHRLATPVMLAVSKGERPSKLAAENLHALRRFALSENNAAARIRCGRYLANVAMMSGSQTDNPYAVASNDVVLAMLEDPNPEIRAGAAKDLWGTSFPANARALLKHALHDPMPAVAAASYLNLHWPMLADIAASRDRALYADAVAQGLKSKQDIIVGAALSAYVDLHLGDADSFLRTYALDRRPLVRLGAIDAYDRVTRVTQSMVRFVESRLRDTDKDVRESAMLRVFRWGDHDAVPQLEQLARTASTADERATAREYVVAMKKQPDLVFP